jgi:hypothetical protein
MVYAIHQEHHFESAICEHLSQHGWRYAEGDAAHYDRQNALHPAACNMLGLRAYSQFANGE